MRIKKEDAPMHVIFIGNESDDKSIAMCYNYLKEKYIREKVLKTNERDACLGDICKSEYRGAS